MDVISEKVEEHSSLKVLPQRHRALQIQGSRCEMTQFLSQGVCAHDKKPVKLFCSHK